MAKIHPRKRWLLPLIFMIASSVAYGQETADDLHWDFAYVDLGRNCQQYYSLYPPSVTCIEGRLYGIRYKISYLFHGKRREVYLKYIPDKNAPLDADGNIIRRDYTVKMRD